MPRLRLSAPAGAQPAPLPAVLQPALAALVAQPPAGAWLFEIKFDGYRMLARIVRPGGPVQLLTRNGHDWTERFPTLVRALRAARLPPGWYDGEIVMPDAQGRPSFHALQAAIAGADNSRIVYTLFDLPFADGLDLRRVAVEQRRAMLQALVPEGEQLRFSHALEAPIDSLLASACDMGLEGLIGKRLGSPYADGRRTGDWIKLKCTRRQEFVIGGFTPQEGTGAGIGALLVGTWDAAGALHYAGKVGSGFGGDELTRLRQRLDAIRQPHHPFAEATGHERRATWVRPELVCELAYGEWAEGRQLRHAAFKGLREDTPPRSVGRERPLERVAAAAPPVRARGAAASAGLSTTAAEAAQPARRAALPASAPAVLTHALRVIDASTGRTKQDLFDYYEAVAPLMLPHVQDRLVYLLRAPQGLSGATFFQRHPGALKGLRAADPALWPGHAPGIVIDSAADLLAAVQLGAIEFHVRNTRNRHIDRPDRVVFDLDPGEGVAWQEVQEAALLVRTLLHELGLQAWLKTSGGRGLHVVVPCRPEFSVETVRDWSQAVVRHMARTIAQRFVARPGAARRVGRIFIDWLRNGREQSTVAAYSARARPGLGVSMPLAWELLDGVTGGAHWDTASAPAHLAQRAQDPWGGATSGRQSLRAALGRLGAGAG
ncbi:DNA ligase D [Ramlibacter sp. AN1015]|uniref:DNA ligase D n=1 Tax=Ramlibacter sp. AN1015 TaxID=3133428 RepID=UPI0030BBF91E